MMIAIRRISDVKPGEYDSVWAIVRSMKKQSPWMQQVPELSPSWDLFKKYRSLHESGQWDLSAFENLYVPQFLDEMKAPESRARLNELYARSKTERIALVCFCPNETMCHRSIIGGLLQGTGCQVDMQTDRRHYYAKYAAPLRDPGETPSLRGDFSFLSNMATSPMVISVYGHVLTFHNAEAAYQAHKDPARCTEFARLTGKDAKKLGRSVQVRADWDEIKDEIMRFVLTEKFRQNPELKQALLRVVGPIEERNYWRDTYWGTCNGVGENRLGKLLMELRRQFEAQP